MKNSKVFVGCALAVAAWLALVVPASARWVYGNGATDLDVTGNGGGAQVCFNRIKGYVGASGYGDPATFVAPPAPYGTRTVQVFASDVDLAGSVAVPGGLKRNDGVVVPPAATQTTSQLTRLSPYESYQDFSGDKYTVYARAPFNIVPPAGSVHVGDSVAVKISGYSPYVNTVAADCAPSSK